MQTSSSISSTIRRDNQSQYHNQSINQSISAARARAQQQTRQAAAAAVDRRDRQTDGHSTVLWRLPLTMHNKFCKTFILFRWSWNYLIFNPFKQNRRDVSRLQTVSTNSSTKTATVTWPVFIPGFQASFWREGICNLRWHVDDNACPPGARFTKYLTTIILRLSYDNAKVAIDFRRTDV